MPDVEIRNLQSFETHTILSKLEGLWVDASDHSLMHALASRITFICPMRFNSFPLDVQVFAIFTLQEIYLYFTTENTLFDISVSLSVHFHSITVTFQSLSKYKTHCCLYQKYFQKYCVQYLRYNIFLFTTIPRSTIRCDQVLTMLIPSSK